MTDISSLLPAVLDISSSYLIVNKVGSTIPLVKPLCRKLEKGAEAEPVGVFTGDIYRDHVVSCAGIVGIKHRHNVVRDTLVDICYRSGISSGKEVDIGLGGGSDKSLRPADVLLYSWDVGRDVCVDLDRKKTNKDEGDELDNIKTDGGLLEYCECS
ncbi:hypothetical protein Tco_0450343 [Tanacetum coccineum]